jgi:hypothetical protein
MNSRSIFRSAVGKLMYIQEDYPDAAFAIKEMARNLQRPTVTDWSKLKHLIRYLLGRQGHAVRFQPVRSNVVQIFCDSNWASCGTTRRSTDMLVIIIHNCLIHASSKTQQTIALSSGEAELGAIHRAAIMAVYIDNLLKEIGFEKDLRIEIFSDSSTGRAMATRAGVGRVKHLSIRMLFVQKLLGSGRFSLHRVSTEDNVADLGTKNLDGPRIEHLTKMLNIVSTSTTTTSCIASLTRKQRRIVYHENTMKAASLASLPSLVKGEGDNNHDAWWSWFYMFMTAYVIIHLIMDVVCIARICARRRAAPTSSSSSPSPAATGSQSTSIATSSSTAAIPLLADTWKDEIYITKLGAKVHFYKECSNMKDPIAMSFCRKCLQKKRSD